MARPASREHGTQPSPISTTRTTSRSRLSAVGRRSATECSTSPIGTINLTARMRWPVRTPWNPGSSAFWRSGFPVSWRPAAGRCGMASVQVVLLGRKRLLCLCVPLHVSGTPGSVKLQRRY